MAVSLYDISVNNYLQILDATLGVLEKGEAHAAEKSLDLGDIVATRLSDDMNPFHFQVLSVWHQSLGAIRGVQEGVFTPPPNLQHDYAGLKGLIVEAASELRALSEDEVNALEGKAMKFKMGDFEIPFTAENFILSFSLPNFYFHATTTYDILRMIGVPLGKLDFLGAMRISA